MDSVHLSRLRHDAHVPVGQDTQSAFEMLMKLRDDALLQLDALKKNVGLNKAGEAEIVYTVNSDAGAAIAARFGVDLEDVVGCGYHSIVVDPNAGDLPTVTVVDRRETYARCARSWKRRPDVGGDAEFPELSARDADAVRAGR